MKKSLKKLMICLTVLLFSCSAFALPLDMFTKISPSIVWNTLDSVHGAPSPVQCMPGIGLKYPNEGLVSFQPVVEWYSNYNLWYDGKALPAEIENRTVSTQNFYLTLPVMFTFEMKETGFFKIKHRIEVGGGPAVLLRFSNIAMGVKPDSPGFSGTALSDKQRINEYMWGKARFLYMNLQSAWLFSYDTLQVGPAINVNFPIGSLIAGEGLNALVTSISIKLVF